MRRESAVATGPLAVSAFATAVLAMAVLAVAVAGCTGTGAVGARASAGVPARPAGAASSPARAAGSVSPAPSHHPAASVTARLVLPARTLAAGSRMAGRLVIDNNTGHTIGGTVCISDFKVLLVGARVRQDAVWLQCAQHFKVPAGESSWPVEVDAFYLMCGNGKPFGDMPSCLSTGRAPPLPPGVYKAVVAQSTRLFADPAAITIRVSAAP
jgi:hypothetical protein